MARPSPRSAIIADEDLGEGVYPLCLRIGELEQLEEVMDCGMATIYRRLTDGDWKVKDVREVLRLALIGGGMPPYEAAGMINRLITEGYFGHYYVVAQAVIQAAVMGYENAPPEKPMTPTESETPTN